LRPNVRLMATEGGRCNQDLAMTEKVGRRKKEGKPGGKRNDAENFKVLSEEKPQPGRRIARQAEKRLTERRQKSTKAQDRAHGPRLSGCSEFQEGARKGDVQRRPGGGGGKGKKKSVLTRGP